MTDFLKAHPFISVEDYMWNMNPCMLRLMTIDNTRVHYLTEKQKERRNAMVIDGKKNTLNDLGVPIF